MTQSDLTQLLANVKGNKPVEKAVSKVKKRSKYGNVKVGTNDSISENKFATQLRLANIEFTEKDSFEIQESFEYMGENVRAICIEPDFVIRKGGKTVAIVDVKHITGYSAKKKDGTKTPIIGTAEWRNKIKMLKLLLSDSPVPMFFPVSEKQKDDTIVKLLEILNKPK